jgi:TonB family protein
MIIKPLLTAGLILNIVLVFTSTASAQLKAKEMIFTEQGLEPVYLTVDQMPELRGGEEWLIKFIQSNVVYPEYARKNKIAGTVYIDFVVDKLGNVTNVKLRRGVEKSVDDEALRVVRLIPSYTPGYLNGNPVNVQYTIPIRFNLGKPNKKDKPKIGVSDAGG